METHLDFPYHLDVRGSTAETGENDHIRDLIWQVLFTSPGERVNRPDFGCGLRQLVFMPNGEVLATATQFLVRGSLQRWLEGIVEVRGVEVEARDGALHVTVAYVKRTSGEPRVDEFTWEGLT